MVNYLYWSPRVLGIGCILITALISFDTINQDNTMSENVMGLLIHLVPTIVLVVAISIGWKNALYGAMIFNIMAVFSIFLFDIYSDFITFLIICLALLLIGELFFIDWYREYSKFD